MMHQHATARSQAHMVHLTSLAALEISEKAGMGSEAGVATKGGVALGERSEKSGMAIVMDWSVRNVKRED